MSKIGIFGISVTHGRRFGQIRESMTIPTELKLKGETNRMLRLTMLGMEALCYNCSSSDLEQSRSAKLVYRYLRTGAGVGQVRKSSAQFGQQKCHGRSRHREG
jgi:hypothetical protein